MDDKTLVRIYTPGGMISPGNFKSILSKAYELGAPYIQFGTRQNVHFHAVNQTRKAIGNKLRALPYFSEIGVQTHENICTSYVTAGVHDQSTPWVNASTFHAVMEGFNYYPTLKINITDPIQSWVPRFTGHLNFIASEVDNFWHLFMHFPDSINETHEWPSLVYSEDIGKLSKVLEQLYFEKGISHPDVLVQLVNKEIDLYTRVPEKDLVIPHTRFPYFEGIYRMNNGKYWLGFYWRNNKYPIDFLEQVYLLCSRLDIGKICLTPWKSVLIKDIKESQLIEWEKLLGQFGINLRHSSNDLNWQVPDLDDSAIRLKSFLVKELDKYDVRTKGITISLETSRMELFTSVVIKKVKSLKLFGYEFFKRYNVLINEGFLPHKLNYVEYEQYIPESRLLKAIQDISRYYYMTLTEGDVVAAEPKQEKLKLPIAWQCQSCLTIYDEVYGDPELNIAPGTSFESLPSDFCCNLCGSEKSGFKKTVVAIEESV